MTVMEFFGCSFIAFGPPVALFIFTIARDPLRIIVMITSAFFWLLALLLSSILWFAVVPLREDLAFGLVFSVIFQEGFRLLFFFLLKKANEGLKKVSERESEDMTMALVSNKHLMAYVAGFGFGVISGAFSLVNVLADMTGPGTIGIKGNSDVFFIASAFLTLCFILLHTVWGVIFHNGCTTGKWYQPLLVLASHMLVSCLTLFNQRLDPIYEASIIPAYVILVIMTVWAFFIAGGTFQSLRAFLGCNRREYIAN